MQSGPICKQNLVIVVHSYRLEIIVEMLECITSRDLGCEQWVSEHVWHQARGCVPAHSAAARQQQRATGSAQDPIHSGDKVTHFPEQEEVQLPVITAVHHYSLHGKHTKPPGMKLHHSVYEYSLSNKPNHTMYFWLAVYLLYDLF